MPSAAALPTNRGKPSAIAPATTDRRVSSFLRAETELRRSGPAVSLWEDTHRRHRVRRSAHPTASSVLPPALTDLAAISTKAITHGAVPLFTQLWMVPRCTSTSPAFR